MTDYCHVLRADLVERAEQWANDGKHVLVSALDATFQRKPFLNVLEVIPCRECYQADSGLQ